ncbi:MAG TPA: hypothetical protein VMC83_24755, partial [Streptosporangiaceae bacterium]|nr:hypothetical protein [Streptosporangiaceae bacterium]
LLSSHILSEVEALCERVTIIRDGRTVETGTLAEMRHLTRTSISADLARRPASLAALPGVHDLDVQDFTRSGSDGLGARVRCEVDSDKLDAVLRRLADAGVLSLVSQPPTLEELFLRHYAAAGTAAAGTAAEGTAAAGTAAEGATA